MRARRALLGGGGDARLEIDSLMSQRHTRPIGWPTRARRWTRASGPTPASAVGSSTPSSESLIPIDPAASSGRHATSVHDSAPAHDGGAGAVQSIYRCRAAADRQHIPPVRNQGSAGAQANDGPVSHVWPARQNQATGLQWRGRWATGTERDMTLALTIGVDDGVRCRSAMHQARMVVRLRQGRFEQCHPKTPSLEQDSRKYPLKSRSPHRGRQREPRPSRTRLLSAVETPFPYAADTSARLFFALAP